MAYSKQTWHDLPDQTTPINAERLNHIEDGIYNDSVALANKIVDEYSTSTEKGYSANYVNELNTYSTSETIVGTWTDGKPIYRKSLGNDISVTNNVRIYDMSTLNVDTLVNIFSINKRGTNTFIGNYYESSSDKLNIHRENNLLVAWTGTNGYTSTVIIEYTKTSD